MSNKILVISFVLLWLITFLPAWYFLGKLSVYAATPNKKLFSIRFAFLFLVYESIIAAPYIPLIIFGDELPAFIKSIVWAVLLVGVLVGTLRFFAASKIEKILWSIYGYVYDGLNNFYPYEALIEDSVRRLGVISSDNVLDLGCGSGNASAKIAELKPASLTCVDSSKSMMRPIKKKIGSAKANIYIDDALCFLEKSEDAVYDKIVMINVLYAVHDREKLWSELMRVLSANGRIVMTSSDKKGSLVLIKEHLKHRSFFSLLNPKLIAVFVIDALISSFAGTGVFHFISREEMTSEIIEAGGKVSEVERCYGGSKSGVNLIMNIEKS